MGRHKERLPKSPDPAVSTKTVTRHGKRVEVTSVDLSRVTGSSEPNIGDEERIQRVLEEIRDAERTPFHVRGRHSRRGER
ncbi:MAG: hypothetical protein HYW62_02595 [Candidatus Levybacteria bacterium]|nr:hypothetical protein [Candidatus Levybacteria bacterium]